MESKGCSKYSQFHQPFIILWDVNDAQFFKVAWIKLPFGKYLAFKTFAQRESGFVLSLKHCLANIARLNEYRSLKPVKVSTKKISSSFYVPRHLHMRTARSNMWYLCKLILVLLNTTSQRPEWLGPLPSRESPYLQWIIVFLSNL